jgi:hypothetical protein
MSIGHVGKLEDRELSLFFLLLPFVVEAEDCLPHHPGQEEDLVDLGFCWGFTGFVFDGDGDLCSEEPFLLLFLHIRRFHYFKCIRNPSHLSSCGT